MEKKGSIVQGKAYEFAIRIVRLCQELTASHKEYVLSKQLLKSGTSIGANIAEANGGISTNDFSAKMSIAYKESLETKYWLNLLHDTGYLKKEMFQSLHSDADELSRILFSILKTTRIHKKDTP